MLKGKAILASTNATKTVDMLSLVLFKLFVSKSAILGKIYSR